MNIEQYPVNILEYSRTNRSRAILKLHKFVHNFICEKKIDYFRHVSSYNIHIYQLSAKFLTHNFYNNYSCV